MEAPAVNGPEYTAAFPATCMPIWRATRLRSCCPCAGAWRATPRWNQADGIHPNAQARAVLADTVWQALRPVLDGPVRGEPPGGRRESRTTMIALERVTKTVASGGSLSATIPPHPLDHRADIRASSSIVGPSGSRQVDAARADRRPRRADGWTREHRRHRHQPFMDEDSAGAHRAGEKIGFIFQFFHLVPSG